MHPQSIEFVEPYPDATPWDRLDYLMLICSEHGADVRVKLEVQSNYAWSCELSLTPHPNRRLAPDISFTAYQIGPPEEAINGCVDAVARALPQVFRLRVFGKASDPRWTPPTDPEAQDG